jgi:hypothetical protein
MRKGGGVNNNPRDYDYEPAPVEKSLAAARGILARLFDLPLLPVAEDRLMERGGVAHDLESLRSRVCIDTTHFTR